MSTPAKYEQEEEDLSFLERFRYINGRRFHNEQSSMNHYYPNDSEESNRLNIQHYLLRYIWKGNYSSPITEKLKERNTSVLDIGCGPGIWVLDMAQKYPQSSFVGIDISSMCPSSNKTPLNAIFLQHNIIEGLPWPSNTFDFIYQRSMSLSFVQKDLAKIFHEIVRVTKIDGWIEIMNFGCSLKNCGKSTKRLMNAVLGFYESKNLILLKGEEIEKMLKDSGKITNIQYEEKYTPIGKWSDQIGEVTMLNFTMGFSGFKIFLAPFMNLSIEQFDALLNEVEKEFDYHHTCIHTYRVYGKKSFDI